MSAPHADQILAGYLKRLDAELAPLPAARRREILAEIQDHIEEARAALPEETDADILTILDRVGEPEEIGAETRARFDLAAPSAGPLELAALLLAGVGALVLPFVTWVLGVLLVWRSPCWTPREKQRGAYAPLVAGLALLLVSALLPFLLVGLGILVGGILLPLAGTGYLAARLGRRLPALAWAGAALAALVVLLPVAAVLAPSRTYGFLGGEATSSVPTSNGGSGCGAFYGTTDYGGGLAGSGKLSVGLCWDGGQIRKTWGPDCYPNSGPLARVTQKCRLDPQPDGSLILSMQTTATATTAPLFTRGEGNSWRLTPDGRLER